MKNLSWFFGIFLVLAGIIILIFAIMSGAVLFGLFLIFPVIIGTGIIAALSFILIFAGIFILFFSLPFGIKEVENEERPRNVNTKFGGVVLIGPFPLVFGSDKKLIYVSIALLILFIVLLELYLLFRF